MGGNGFWRRFGAVGLALLPLSAVACLIAAMARDASEIAGAAAAVGAVLSVVACAHLALLNQETRRLGEKQAELRAQALALARCMRVLNARTAQAESTDIASPVAKPDATPPQRAVAPVVGGRGVVPKLCPVHFLPGLERWGVILRFPSIESESRMPWLTPRSGDAVFRDAVLASLMNGDVPEGRILAVAPDRLSRLPLALAALLSACRDSPQLCERLLLGAPQSALRDPDEARVVAELARAGLCMALVGVEDFRLDPEALAACNFTCVEASADSLLAVAGMSSRAAVGLAALTKRFAASGVALVCTQVDTPGQAARLAALGVSAAAGSSFAPETEIVTIPWRAAPAPAPPGRLAGLLRRAG